MDAALGLADQVSAPFSLTQLLLNLAVGLLLALIVSWHYKRFGSTLSNREEFGLVFPFIALTVCLIITVVKSSLALSLGLVGALSIVRFRTPIKEPEELAYLFFTIAIGLGLGAGYTLETSAAAVVVMAAMAGVKLTRGTRSDDKRVTMTIDLIGEVPAGALDELTKLVHVHAKLADLRRYDHAGDGLQTTWILDLEGAAKVGALSEDVRKRFPSSSVSFLDQRQLPSA